mmetsp:Transcript_23188/g.53823  ORF Transcript_23188/g.53823 Transcript_23188/m.53823 type:complete len:300 (+) Transcript_23188:432-1331(+)
MTKFSAHPSFSSSVDVAYVIICQYGFSALYANKSLVTIEQEFAKSIKGMEEHNHKLALTMMQPCKDVVYKLRTGLDPEPASLYGEEEKVLNDYFARAVLSLLKAIGAFLFRDLHQAKDYAVLSLDRFRRQPMFTAIVCQGQFYAALMFASCLRWTKVSAREKIWYRREIRRATKSLEKWAEANPGNCSSKLYLLEAEIASLDGDTKRADMKYMSALSLSASENFGLEYALGNELAARSMLSRSNSSSDGARHHMEIAYMSYMKWGAVGKANHLKKEMNGMFSPSIDWESIPPSASKDSR